MSKAEQLGDYAYQRGNKVVVRGPKDSERQWKRMQHFEFLDKHPGITYIVMNYTVCLGYLFVSQYLDHKLNTYWLLNDFLCSLISILAFPTFGFVTIFQEWLAPGYRAMDKERSALIQKMHTTDKKILWFIARMDKGLAVRVSNAFEYDPDAVRQLMVMASDTQDDNTLDAFLKAIVGLEAKQIEKVKNEEKWLKSMKNHDYSREIAATYKKATGQELDIENPELTV